MRSTADAALVIRLRVPSASVNPRISSAWIKSVNCSAISSSCPFNGSELLPRRGVDRGLDGGKALNGVGVRRLECLDQIPARLGGKIARAQAHLDQRGAELAADVGEIGSAFRGLECPCDLRFACREGDAVEQESDHRDEGQRDDARAHRHTGHDAESGQSHWCAAFRGCPVPRRPGRLNEMSRKWLRMSEIRAFCFIGRQNSNCAPPLCAAH